MSDEMGTKYSIVLGVVHRFLYYRRPIKACESNSQLGEVLYDKVSLLSPTMTSRDLVKLGKI